MSDTRETVLITRRQKRSKKQKQKLLSRRKSRLTNAPERRRQHERRHFVRADRRRTASRQLRALTRPSLQAQVEEPAWLEGTSRRRGCRSAWLAEGNHTQRHFPVTQVSIRWHDGVPQPFDIKILQPSVRLRSFWLAKRYLSTLKRSLSRSISPGLSVACSS